MMERRQNNGEQILRSGGGESGRLCVCKGKLGLVACIEGTCSTFRSCNMNRWNGFGHCWYGKLRPRTLNCHISSLNALIRIKPLRSHSGSISQFEITPEVMPSKYHYGHSNSLEIMIIKSHGRKFWFEEKSKRCHQYMLYLFFLFFL